MGERLTRMTSGTILALVLLLTLVPLVLLFYESTKDNLDILLNFWNFPHKIKWLNYTTAFSAVRLSILHSLLVCFSTVLGAVLLGSLSGYAFARHTFSEKNFLYMMLLGVLMIPSVLTIVPLYSVVVKLHLTHSYLALILPYIAGTQLLGILLCRTFFESLPGEMFEAAKMDGANEFYTYSRIALPLCLPVLVTIGIVTFLAVYNDYLWPVIVLGRNQLTFTVAAVSLTTAGRQDIGLSFAAYVIGSVPTILVIAFGMKYYVDGMVSGSIKS